MPLSGFISGKILASNSASWVAGDLIGGGLPFSTFQIVTAEHMAVTTMWKLTDYISEDQLSWGVGVFGMPGSTAYGGLIDVLR